MLVSLPAIPGAAALAPDWLPSQYAHQRFSTADGLPADIVWELEQTGQGYLWAGTQNGLARFDGVRFTVFASPQTPGFTANDVRALAESPTGTLWIGTYGGGAMHLAGSRFQPLTVDDGLASNIVYDILIDSDGSVWFATAEGISRLRDGRIRTWRAKDGLAANRVFKIIEDEAGDLWFATLTGGLSHFDGESFENFTDRDGLDSVQTHLLANDRTGLLVGTYAGGLYRYADGGLQPLPRGTLPEDLSMHSILRDRGGQLWIGSYGGGLWRWSIGGPARKFELAADSPTHVFDLLEDTEGNLWLGSMNGLHRLRSGDFRPWGDPEGLADSTFVVAESPSTGAIWAGSEGRGLFRLAPDGSIERFGTGDGLSSNNVSALRFDSRGRFWVGTFGGGLHLFSGGRAEPFALQDRLPGRQIFSVLEHSDGAIWVATEGGVARIAGGTVDTLSTADGLPADLVRHMLEDRNGGVWMSTPGGLAHHANGRIRTFGEAEGLADNIVSTTFEDAGGTIWIGMRNGGLARLAGDRLFQFGTEHGLPLQSVLAIVADRRGNLWLSGLSGLVRVARDRLDAVAEGRAERIEARLFDEADGLRSTRFMVGFQPAGIRADDGRIWFPTNRGLISFRPGEITPDRLGAGLIIEEIRVDAQPVALAEPAHLPAGARSLEIEYTVPRLHASDRVRFRYRLDGSGEPWQQAGTRRTAYFTNLPPGPQLFEVQAALAQHGFGDPEHRVSDTLTVIRAPHWYQTWWFRISMVVATALALLAVYRIALGLVRQRQQRLEALVEQRTRELSEALTKVERLSRIDGLTGVTNRRYFEERLRRAWTDCLADGKPISIVMLDIDRFKQYNDSAGHQAGDECLRRVASALESGLVRDQDLVARYGGEEFVLLLPTADERAAHAIAERIRCGIEALRIPHPDSDVADHVTVSLGCATARGDRTESPDELVDRADRALYEAKRGGRNRTVCD